MEAQLEDYYFKRLFLNSMIFLLQDDPPHKSIPSNRSQLKKIEEEEKFNYTKDPAGLKC